MIKLISILVFLVLLSSIYQDFPLINTYGELARSPVVFFTPFMLMYLGLFKRIFISQYVKVFMLYIAYLIVISVIFTVFFILRVEAFSLFEENVIVKTIKMSLYPLVSFVLYLFVLNYLKSNDNFIFTLAKQIYFIQLLLLTILIVEWTQNSDGYTVFHFLHSSQRLYWRIRLLTLESSWSGSIAVIFSLLPVYFVNQNILKYKKSLVFITSFSFLVLYSISSESKGYLLLFLLSTLPNLIIAINKSQYRKYIFLAIIPTTLVLSTIFVNLYDNIVQQFYTSITFGTRFSSYVASLRVSVLHPFGVGLGPYVYYYTESIRTVLDTGLMSAFNLNEIKGYLSTTTALSTKTYFFNQLMFGGIGFLIFYYHFFYKRYKKLTKNPSTGTLKVIFIFIILSGIIYITYHIKYEIWIFLAIIDYLETNKGYKIVKNEK
ncbi:MAG: hypothetical protein P8P27_05665 [Flavobacteriaceae bacterium]|jgi:hypothetical protein|nr:hypothetical protein [Flavobacteriaceae bacterium]